METEQTYQYDVAVTQFYRVSSEIQLSEKDIRVDWDDYSEYQWLRTGVKFDIKEENENKAT